MPTAISVALARSFPRASESTVARASCIILSTEGSECLPLLALPIPIDLSYVCNKALKGEDASPDPAPHPRTMKLNSGLLFGPPLEALLK